jgi:hypothetical protein
MGKTKGKEKRMEWVWEKKIGGLCRRNRREGR